jgi:hypothetical protein
MSRSARQQVFVSFVAWGSLLPGILLGLPAHA